MGVMEKREEAKTKQIQSRQEIKVESKNVKPLNTKAATLVTRLYIKTKFEIKSPLATIIHFFCKKN